MNDSILPHWLFLYGTPILYFVLGFFGLWWSSKRHPPEGSTLDAVKPRADPQVPR